MQKHRVSLLKTTTFSCAVNVPESAEDSKKTQNSIVEKQGMTMLLENNKVQRVIGDSKSSITVIEHELSQRTTAHGIAIIMVHRDYELLASARWSNSKLLAETWGKTAIFTACTSRHQHKEHVE